MTKVSEVIDELMTVNFEPSGNATDLYPTTNPFKANEATVSRISSLESIWCVA